MATMIVSKLNRQLNIGLPSPLNARHPYIDPVSLIKAIHKTLGLEGSSSAADPAWAVRSELKEGLDYGASTSYVHVQS